MSVAGLLSELRRRDIQLWLDAGQLRCSAPAGALTPELRDQLRDRKNDILEFLRSVQALERQQPSIVPLQQNGQGIPVFGVPGHNGDVFSFRHLAQCLGNDQPFFGLQPPGLVPNSQPATRVEDLASSFAAQICAFQPHGPYIIAGLCSGGVIAFELAQQLLRGGAKITFVALFGSPYPTYFRFPVYPVLEFVHRLQRGYKHALKLRTQSWRERCLYVADELERRRVQRQAASAPAGILRNKVERATMRAVSRYAPTHFAGRVCLMLPCKEWASSGFAALRWQTVAQHTEQYFGPDGCIPDNMLREPNVETFTEIFRGVANATARLHSARPDNGPTPSRR